MAQLKCWGGGHVPPVPPASTPMQYATSCIWEKTINLTNEGQVLGCGIGHLQSFGHF